MAWGADEALNIFFGGMDMGIFEDYSRLGLLEVPKKDISLEVGEPSSSSKLVRQFPTPSVDPELKRTVMLTIPRDARILSALVGVDS